ncbi:hypothetical protein J0H58_25460 [bacterium]|nr:hypothetical protein [bacterium]
MNALLTETCKILVASAAAAAATTDLDGAVIDVGQDGGYDGIVVVAFTGDVTATSVLELQLQGSALANGSSPSTEATTGTFTAGATDADSKLLLLDVARPANRYVFSRLKRGTANAVVNGVFYVLYKGHKGVVTQAADVIKSALAVVK